MAKTKFNDTAHPGLDISFWFAIPSPALGVLVGLIALFLSYP